MTAGDDAADGDDGGSTTGGTDAPADGNGGAAPNGDEMATQTDDSEATPDGGEGEMAVPGGGATPEPGAPEPTPSGYSGAPDDEEMPLTEHIREMVQRLGVVIVVMGLISLVTFPFADRLINMLWYSFLPGSPEACGTQAAATQFEAIVQAHAIPGEGSAACPRVYHPLALVLSRLKVASLAGFIIALPVFVYQTYLFMRPGLYPNERRYYLASVPTSLVLAFIGVGFAFFLVLPFIFTYFLTYSEPVANIAFGLSDTFGLILLMMGMFAAIFQIPLFMMLAIMMGVTNRRWLEERRLYFWAGFAGVAFLFSPDPTGMAPFIVGITMVGLFESTLVLLRWTGR